MDTTEVFGLPNRIQFNLVSFTCLLKLLSWNRNKIYIIESDESE